jgi:hypothetical protein
MRGKAVSKNMAQAKYEYFIGLPPFFVFMITSNGGWPNRRHARKFFDLCKWCCEGLCEAVNGKQKRQRWQRRQKTPFTFSAPFAFFTAWIPRRNKGIGREASL